MRLSRAQIPSWLRRAPFLSRKDLVHRALFISVAFAVVQGTGLREFTSVLNGTVGSTELGWTMSAFLGILYVALYLAFVVFVPVLLLAAGLITLWQVVARKNQEPTQHAGSD